MITVTRDLHFTRKARGRHQIAKERPATESAETGQAPRISKLMALAIHCDELIRNGDVAHQFKLARLLHVTQPRMTQIMNLLLLALLFLPQVVEGKDPVTERNLRPVVAEVECVRQRRIWKGV